LLLRVLLPVLLPLPLLLLLRLLGVTPERRHRGRVRSFP